MNSSQMTDPNSACKLELPRGAIQPAGRVACFEANTGRLAWSSHPADAPNRVPPDLLEQLRETPERRLYRFGVDEGRYDICAYRAGHYDVVESLETVPGGVTQLHDLLFNARERLASCDTLESLLEASTRLVKIVLDADGCMALEFTESGAGRVVSECRKGSEKTRYLGWWFPATDVPPAVRALYAQCPARVVFSVEEEPLPLQPLLGPQDCPDLSRGYLRAVAPVHLKYMTNMGMKASLSLAIFCEGKLWGLLLSHFKEKLKCRLASILTCQLLAEHVGSRLHILRARESEKKRKVWMEVREQANRTLGTQGFLGALESLSPALSGLLDTAPGLAFVDEERVVLIGMPPSEHMETALRSFVSTVPTSEAAPLFATKKMEWPDNTSGGALVMEMGLPPCARACCFFPA